MLIAPAGEHGTVSGLVAALLYASRFAALTKHWLYSVSAGSGYDSLAAPRLHAL